MLIIGIAGGTGSGKTKKKKKIIESLPAGQTAVIPQDLIIGIAVIYPQKKDKNINF